MYFLFSFLQNVLKESFLFTTFLPFSLTYQPIWLLFLLPHRAYSHELHQRLLSINLKEIFSVLVLSKISSSSSWCHWTCPLLYSSRNPIFPPSASVHNTTSSWSSLCLSGCSLSVSLAGYSSQAHLLSAPALLQNIWATFSSHSALLPMAGSVGQGQET